ncbi:PREDICTED: tetratricopeptide repeat protein 7A isoform X1 [Tarenaya hassleriana]|uniref:tetratricopeptide repeat protein 7A isoform X1 n=1 Tax=Tarenaya hassleriana TaxID=28532 RepID=UPI00053C50A3|nr:PREDICTED: tetratricopeptide repeat protein 7A isoform X1 [Tarenaya hassleriana]XP_010556457.1 PREDICTED: tetratricopeptide repeat protein 7A isoform X1 [Tarenaya hassleriana]XP_010556458.1 PREDICTED: tetratricopeptide repeat protein 7A isoform X1 [Tarenaya hassleriana]XP_010556459.1 PREDICTED: tetratricopeptide repeat protein 7A isoform X1 [Tarenaya hassleriana]XP_010556460.1 PREDICTED: tetratricopeptide repeat protein 7A isoform X1 [Tarenaya hassleriana]XP_010556461.1 PREDICTED: tetratric
MLCACSGEQFRLEEPPQSPDSLATRDFSARGLSSRTGNGDWDSKLEEIQVDEAESTLKEALSLNYEEARALLGRLEYQRGNFDAALQVFQGIDIRALTPRMIKAIKERTRPRKPRSRIDIVPPSVMSMHSVSLLLEAIFLKSRSLEELGSYREAAVECKIIFDTVESAFPKGMPGGISQVCKLQDVFHKALELLPCLWTKAGHLHETIASYRRALVKPWNLDPQKLAATQKALASVLLYGGVEASSKDNTQEAILLLLILVKKAVVGEIEWDPELMDHLSFALSVTGQFELLANYVEQILPGVYTRGERWYFLSLCYSAAGDNEAAINLLKKASGPSEARQAPQASSLLLGAKLCSEDTKNSRDGIDFAHRLLDLANNQSEHLLGRAHRFLGACYGNAARISMSDSERVFFQKKFLQSLNRAAKNAEDDPEVIFDLSVENAVQRNLKTALDGAVEYSSTVAGVSARAWKHLSLVLSAEKRLEDAENVLEFAMEEADEIEQLELLKLKAVLQMAQDQPKQAIRTYSTMLTIIRAQAQPEGKKSNQYEDRRRNFEMEAWQDLASIYGNLGSWSDAETCLEKAKSIAFYCPRGWHATGLSLEARSLHEEALASFFLSLSIEPDHVPSIVSTAEVMVKSGGESLAIARSFLMNALRLDPTNHEAWMNLGLIAKMQGLPQQAAEFYQAAYELKLSAPVQSFI